MSPDPAAGGGAAGAGALPAGGAPGPGAGAAPAGGQPAAGGTPSPYYADLIGKDGTLNHASFERLPENLKGLAPSLANVKNVDGLLEKIHHLNGLAGRKGLAPLAADAKPEDVAAHQAVLRAVIGVPEKPEGYGFVRPAELPEAAWDPVYAKTAQELLHKHNASPALAKDLLAMQTQMVQGNIAAQQEYEANFYRAQDDEFRATLTKDGQDYDKSMALIDRVALQLGVAKDNPLLKNATYRSTLLAFAKATGEAKFVDGAGGETGTKSDLATAEDIMHNKQNPDYPAYWANVNGAPDHPKSAEVRKRVEALLSSAALAERSAQGGGRR